MKSYKFAFRQSVKTFKEMSKKSKMFRRTTLLSVLLLALAFALPIWRVIPLVSEQPFLPLHYNIYFGIDRFGPWYYIFIPAILGLVILLINILFEIHFYKREKILTQMFFVLTVITELTLLAATFFSVLAII